MGQYEYKVIPAPTKGLKGGDDRSPEGRFSYAVESALNDMAGEGWEYVRSDLLPCQERKGLTGSRTTYRTLLVFRRPLSVALAANSPGKGASSATITPSVKSPSPVIASRRPASAATPIISAPRAATATAAADPVISARAVPAEPEDPEPVAAAPVAAEPEPAQAVLIDESVANEPYTPEPDPEPVPEPEPAQTVLIDEAVAGEPYTPEPAISEPAVPAEEPTMPEAIPEPEDTVIQTGEPVDLTPIEELTQQSEADPETDMHRAANDQAANDQPLAAANTPPVAVSTRTPKMARFLSANRDSSGTRAARPAAQNDGFMDDDE